MPLRLYNTLSRKLELFKPIKTSTVGMYTCGPTVYDYAHIGNLRTYLFSDIVRRVLSYLGYQVKSVMNITDVGHLVSDADKGEGKLEKGARRERKSAWEIAEKYTKFFLEDMKKLNILAPTFLPKATDHIEEQIDLIKKLEQKGYTYETSDGIYFDSSKFPSYGRLARLDVKGLKEGVRIKKNPEKKQPTDFALWKFSPKGKKRDMEWASPWGIGFPGWHIECSAMSMKYLGETFDLHLGGVDLIPVHHTNEIAQSESATEKKFVNYWLHGEFVLVNGEKMSKSKGNFYNLKDIQQRGFEPLALRYLYLTAHYRSKMNFTWKALEGAQKALNKLRHYINPSKGLINSQNLPLMPYMRRFRQIISDNFDMPGVLALVWKIVKDKSLSKEEKGFLLDDWDKVLGLDLKQKAKSKKRATTVEILKDKKLKELILKREELRKEKKWREADKVRKEIEEKGYLLEDTLKGTKVKENSLKLH